MGRAIKAAVCAGGGAPPKIEDLLLDDPASDEIIIEMGAAAICHTDLGISGWIEKPQVLGHEGAGTIVQIGEKVSDFAVGDRVVATFGSCGNCRNCRNNRPAYCADHVAQNIEGVRGVDRPSLTRPDGTPIGGSFFQQSAFASHALVTERNVVRIPDTLDFVTAAPLGCGIQTGAGAVINNFGAKPGQPLLVIGCGAVGLSAVMAGKIAGCAPIIATDMIEERLQLAREFGAHTTFLGDADYLVDRIRRASEGGVTYALDSAGSQQTFEQALHCLHPGGTLGVLTLPGDFDTAIPHPGGIPFLNTTIMGIIEGDSVPGEFIPWLIEQNAAGRLPYDQLIRTYAFEDIETAFSDLATGQTIKPVLTFS